MKVTRLVWYTWDQHANKWVSLSGRYLSINAPATRSTPLAQIMLLSRTTMECKGSSRLNKLGSPVLHQMDVFKLAQKYATKCDTLHSLNKA